MKTLDINPQLYQCLAIGASAGGIKALLYLLEFLPESFSQSIIIVEHLGKEQNDLLVEIFANLTQAEVIFAEDKMPLQSGKIYIAPPNFHLLLEDDATFALNVDRRVNFSRPSIDVFLDSAAGVLKEKLLVIILTGANNDGAAALQKIKSMGGTTIAQDPEEAEYKTMPAAAIASGNIDLILSLAEISQILQNLNKERIQNGKSKKNKI